MDWRQRILWIFIFMASLIFFFHLFNPILDKVSVRFTYFCQLDIQNAFDNYMRKQVYICIPETFNMNISHQLWLQYNLCEFTMLIHKFKGWFCLQKPTLRVGFKDFWYMYKINLSNLINHDICFWLRFCLKCNQ